MIRALQPEILDNLSPADPRALHARRDLRWVNAIMGNAGTVAHHLRIRAKRAPVDTLVELGAGDGAFALAVMRRLRPERAPRTIVLVDRHPSLRDDTRAAFQALSCRVLVVEADIFDWIGRDHSEGADVMIANLFLHHFSDVQIAALLLGVSRQTGCFLACEPLRSRAALAAAALLPLLGCNGVTRHDASISVRAGFRRHELSALWPSNTGWRLVEQRAGWFSHSFVANHG